MSVAILSGAAKNDEADTSVVTTTNIGEENEMKHIYVRVEVPEGTDIFEIYERIIMEFPSLSPEVSDDGKELVTVYENYEALRADEESSALPGHRCPPWRAR